MIITIGGPPGAGTTAVSQLLAKKLGYRLVTMGELHKRIAGKRGISRKQFHKTWEQDAKDVKALGRFHKKLDAEQKRAALKEKNAIFNSKLGAFQIPNAELRVFLYAPLETRAKRVAEREGITQKAALKSIKIRENLERSEWKKLYGIDYVHDYDVYDIIINTERLGVEQIAWIIQRVAELKKLTG